MAKRPGTDYDDPYEPQDPDAPEGPVGPNPTDPNAPVPPAPPPPPPTTPGPGDPAYDAKFGPTPPPALPGGPGYDEFGQPKIIPEQDEAARIRAEQDAMRANATQGAPTDPRGYFEWLTRGLPGTPGSLLSLEQQLAARGIKVLRNAEGTAGKIQLPSGEIVDVILAAGAGGRGWQWLTGDGGGGGGGAGSSSALDALMNSGVSSSSWMTTPPAWWSTGPPTAAPTGLSSSPALDDARRAALLELLNRKPPTAEELANSPENQAYRLGSQRAAERQRAELAERAAFEGFDNTGFFETELGGINQQRAEGEAGFLGELAISRMQAYREDLQFAISEAQQAGQFDLAQQLQRESMLLDAAIRREQMASSERMAANDLALREFLGRAGIELDRLRLDENQRQFDYDLGYRYTNLDEEGRQFDLNYLK